MALDILGIRGVYVPFVEAEGGIPNPATIEGLITDRTRAILVVSPSNPTGAITPPDTVRELFDLARRHNIVLILDETYNEFIPAGGVHMTCSTTRRGGGISCRSPRSAKPMR